MTVEAISTSSTVLLTVIALTVDSRNGVTFVPIPTESSPIPTTKTRVLLPTLHQGAGGVEVSLAPGGNR